METVLRAAVIYFFLLVVMRAMGRKELTGMSSFELLLIVIMGDLIQQGVTQQDTSLTAAMLAVGTLAVLVTGASYVSYRWGKSQPVLEGLPVVILRDGKLMREALRIERLSEDDVKEAARQQGIGDLAEVTVGVLEADGSFSFITRSGWQHPSGGPPTG